MPLIASLLYESQGGPWHATARLWDDGIIDPAGARRGGAIVDVASVAARTGSPSEYVDYAASKGAIDSLTVGLVVEVAGEGIRVNAVRPGFVHAQMQADGGEPGRVDRLAPSVPLRRGGQPEESRPRDPVAAVGRGGLHHGRIHRRGRWSALRKKPALDRTAPRLSRRVSQFEFKPLI